MPDAVLGAIIKSINGRDPPEPFQAEVNTIADPDSFWEFVRANEGSVTVVTFNVVMPNMFGGKDSFQEEMREIRDRNRAKLAQIKLSNPDGLVLDDNRVREAVDYTTRGGGRVKAKARKKRYDSQDRGRRVRVTPPDAEATQTQDQGILKTAFDTIFKR